MNVCVCLGQKWWLVSLCPTIGSICFWWKKGDSECTEENQEHGWEGIQLTNYIENRSFQAQEATSCSSDWTGLLIKIHWTKNETASKSFQIRFQSWLKSMALFLCSPCPCSLSRTTEESKRGANRQKPVMCPPKDIDGEQRYGRM